MPLKIRESESSGMRMRRETTLTSARFLRISQSKNGMRRLLSLSPFPSLFRKQIPCLLPSSIAWYTSSSASIADVAEEHNYSLLSFSNLSSAWAKINSLQPESTLTKLFAKSPLFSICFPSHTCTDTRSCEECKVILEELEKVSAEWSQRRE